MTEIRGFIPQGLFGTIITAEKFDDNPAHKPDYEQYYTPGYTEVTVLSDGLNPYFSSGKWRFRLVSYRDSLRRKQERLFDKDGPFEQVSIDPDMELTRAETVISQILGVSGRF